MTPHAECCDHVASSDAFPGEERPRLVFEARLFIQQRAWAILRGIKKPALMADPCNRGE